MLPPTVLLSMRSTRSASTYMLPLDLLNLTLTSPPPPVLHLLNLSIDLLSPNDSSLCETLPALSTTLNSSRPLSAVSSSVGFCVLAPGNSSPRQISKIQQLPPFNPPAFSSPTTFSRSSYSAFMRATRSQLSHLPAHSKHISAKPTN